MQKKNAGSLFQDYKVDFLPQIRLYIEGEETLHPTEKREVIPSRVILSLVNKLI